MALIKSYLGLRNPTIKSHNRFYSQLNIKREQNAARIKTVSPNIRKLLNSYKEEPSSGVKSNQSTKFKTQPQLNNHKNSNVSDSPTSLASAAAIEHTSDYSKPAPSDMLQSYVVNPTLQFIDSLASLHRATSRSMSLFAYWISKSERVTFYRDIKHMKR
jgi:hypothetical protein